MFWFFGCKACEILGFPGGSVVKNPTAIQEIWVQSLGWDDSLEKEMATHSSILAWKIPWMEEPGRLQSMGLQSWTHLNDFTFTLWDIFGCFLLGAITKTNKQSCSEESFAGFHVDTSFHFSGINAHGCDC